MKGCRWRKTGLCDFVDFVCIVNKNIWFPSVVCIIVYFILKCLKLSYQVCYFIHVGMKNYAIRKQILYEQVFKPYFIQISYAMFDSVM